MILRDCIQGVVKYENEDYSVRVVVGSDDDVALYFKEDLQDMWMKKATVSFNDSVKGCVKTMCDILIKKNPGYPTMPEYWMGECKILDVLEIVQRQQDIRARVSINIQFTSETEDRGRFFGTITNLSAGGIYMITSEALVMGEELSFHYTFKSVERPFRVKVLWGKIKSTGGHGYGLKFMDLTECAETAIRGYVFNELREQRLRKNGGY